MKDKQGMEGFRARIDALDERIAAALGERFAVCREVAAHKHREGIPMMQHGRIDDIHRRLARLAERHRIDADLLRRVYDLIIQASCDLEDRLIAELAADEEPAGR